MCPPLLLTLCSLQDAAVARLTQSSVSLPHSRGSNSPLKSGQQSPIFSNYTSGFPAVSTFWWNDKKDVSHCEGHIFNDLKQYVHLKQFVGWQRINLQVFWYLINCPNIQLLSYEDFLVFLVLCDSKTMYFCFRLINEQH